MGDGGNTNKEVILVKIILTITALVPFLSIASPSFALDQMSLYTETPERIEIAGEVNGDHVEEGYMDFYIDTLQPQLREESPEPIILADRSEIETSEKNYINIFGVQGPTNNKSGAI